jgi:hypothetical protein
MVTLLNTVTKKHETVLFVDSHDDIINAEIPPTNYKPRIGNAFTDPMYMDGNFKIFMGPNWKAGSGGNAIFIQCTKEGCGLCSSTKSEYRNSKKWDSRNFATTVRAHALAEGMEGMDGMDGMDDDGEEDTRTPLPKKASAKSAKSSAGKRQTEDAPGAPAKKNKVRGPAPAQAQAVIAADAANKETIPQNVDDADAPRDDSPAAAITKAPDADDDADAAEESDDSDALLVPASASASAKGSTLSSAQTSEIKRIVRIYCNQYVRGISVEINMMQNKVNELTGMIGRMRGKRIGKIAMPVHDTSAKNKGECHACRQTHKKGSGNLLKPSWILHCVFGGNIRGRAHGTSTDADVSARTMDAQKLHKMVLLKQRMCQPCSLLAQAANKCAAIDINNQGKFCVVCRRMRVSGATMYCNVCDINKLQTDHANQKAVLHNAFTFLANVVGEVRDVVTSKDLDNGNVNKGELDVMPYGMHDFGLIVTLHDGSKIVFVIEVMATKVEDLAKLAHKFAMARHKYGDKGAPEPTKFVLILLDIQVTGTSSSTLLERIEVMRRWVIFACRYPKLLPTVSNWWMHFGNTRSPYNNMNAPTTQEFFKNPVQIDHAPKGGSLYPPGTGDTDGDWAFASDPYLVMGGGGMRAVTENAVSVYDMLFSKSAAASAAGPSTASPPLLYSQYNVGSGNANGYDVALSCKADCEICAGIHTGNHIVHASEASEPGTDDADADANA